MIVLFILSETTSPRRSFRRVRSTTVDSDIDKLSSLPADGGDLRFDPGNVPPQCAQAGWFFELAACLLQMQVKQFLPQVAVLGLQLFERQIFDLGHFHRGKILSAEFMPR